MSQPLHLCPERFFPRIPACAELPAQLFAMVERLPIVSPHGTRIRLVASTRPLKDAVQFAAVARPLLLRMLMSVGAVTLESLAFGRATRSR